MVKIIENKGDSFETAIKITDATEMNGVDAEYGYLNKRFGPRGQAWKLIQQSLMFNNERNYDKMDIELKDGKRLSIYFDIHDFFGVF